jgi:4-hydroxy-tetrahydrodipicolinate synthase
MQGVIAAVPTPIGKTNSPLKDLFLEHCSWALDNGCDGLNILGSTGEANSLSTAARRDVMAWAADGLDRTRLMVGTGTPSLDETIDLTSFADDLGYGVALVLPPYYYKPMSDAALISWYEALHGALGARPIAIYFYNFPQMTGLQIPVSVIGELARRHPERFKGIKDSSGDLTYCDAIVALGADLAVFPSSETALGGAKAAGYAGCISATTNITGELSAQVWAGQGTAEIETIIAEQRGTIAGAGLIPAIKYLVAKRSGNDAWRHLVPPFLPLDDAAGTALEKALS